MAGMTRELVRRAIEGDHDAFSSLVDVSVDRLHAVANLILRDPDRAQDAVQDALISAWKDVRALRDGHYVWVKINWSKENPNEAVLSRWPKTVGYPHLFVLDADGKLLHSQDTSLLEAGKGYDEAKFVAFLDKWAPGGRAPTPR